ncbi:hypothetical protein D3C75_1078100 [compost metagenome]
MATCAAQYEVSAHAFFVATSKDRPNLALEFGHMNDKHVITRVADPGCGLDETSNAKTRFFLRANRVELSVLGQGNTA